MFGAALAVFVLEDAQDELGRLVERVPDHR